MADKTKLPEPKDLDEAKSLIATLTNGLDASQERVGELDGQLKAQQESGVELTKQIQVLQDNNETLVKNSGGADKLQASVDQLTTERDEAVSENKELTKENVALAKMSKDARAERDRIKEIRKRDSVRTKYVFNGENQPVSMTLCGESVAKEEDGTWLLNQKQFAEAVNHGCDPKAVPGSKEE